MLRNRHYENESGTSGSSIGERASDKVDAGMRICVRVLLGQLRDGRSDPRSSVAGD